MKNSSQKIKFVAGISMLFVLVYAAAYFLLMVRNVPVVDDQGHPVFKSSFRWAHSAGRMGALSIETPEASPFNYVFYPMDKLFYAIAPKEWSLNKLPF